MADENQEVTAPADDASYGHALNDRNHDAHPDPQPSHPRVAGLGRQRCPWDVLELFSICV